MRRLALILSLVLACSGLAQPGFAQPVALEDQIVAALAEQGYAVTAMHRTWLGRLRVVAQNDSHQRELVFDPATGELLDDYLITLSALARRQEARDDRDDDDDAPQPDWSATVRESQAAVAVAIPDAAD